ncbi:YkvI family membrane protein [Bacillus sp. 2205SS5-2]|uniref:YkvI family membrane protein n=1 Tax=Bacillus sp. 2205SS5-2 TaxID=3109031 RepID=UPI0030079609
MNKWKQAFQLAAVYVGTVVGAGFATGKEIVEFFTRFGFIGFIGILLSGYLFIIMGTKMMMKSQQINAKSFEDFQLYLFGPLFGKIMNGIILLMLLGVTAVMLSGAGAVFEEQLHLPKELGVGLTVFLGYLVILIGTKGLYLVNSFVVPMMILFNLLIMISAVSTEGFISEFMWIPHSEDGWKSVVAPFSYAAFNLAMAQAVLVPVASQIKDRQTIKLGGIIGGVMLTAILLSIHSTLIMLPQLELYEIPMAAVMQLVGGGFYWLYVFIIYGEIFTSVIGGIYGLEKQAMTHLTVNRSIVLLFLFAMLYFISTFDYSELLSYLYPLFGNISLIFIILLWMKKDKK